MQPVTIHSLRVLVIEPYYGGSHRRFVEGLAAHLPFRFELFTLPARKWKWRMRLSAPYFAAELRRRKKVYDRILCSSYLDVAAFRGLAPGWVRQVPLLTYFHENQFAYPVRRSDERDFHFGLTNLTTALASDRLAFNSKYNLETFLRGARQVLRHSYDLELGEALEEIRARARVLPPGLDLLSIDDAPLPRLESSSHPVIVWNHRWEHDKNPERFFKALQRLKRSGANFRLIVLGQHFKEIPPVFERARKEFAGEILHFGYARSRSEYLGWLKRGDLVLSTAGHEFFGMAILEAVRAGCRPLLPKRLSYPELFPEKFLYSQGALFSRLRDEVRNPGRLSQRQATALTNRFSWDRLRPAYQAWIAG